MLVFSKKEITTDELSYLFQFLEKDDEIFSSFSKEKLRSLKKSLKETTKNFLIQNCLNYRFFDSVFSESESDFSWIIKAKASDFREQVRRFFFQQLKEKISFSFSDEIEAISLFWLIRDFERLKPLLTQVDLSIVESLNFFLSSELEERLRKKDLKEISEVFLTFERKSFLFELFFLKKVFDFLKKRLEAEKRLDQDLTQLTLELFHLFSQTAPAIAIRKFDTNIFSFLIREKEKSDLLIFKYIFEKLKTLSKFEDSDYLLIEKKFFPTKNIFLSQDFKSFKKFLSIVKNDDSKRSRINKRILSLLLERFRRIDLIYESEKILSDSELTKNLLVKIFREFESNLWQETSAFIHDREFREVFFQALSRILTNSLESLEIENLLIRELFGEKRKLLDLSRSEEFYLRDFFRKNLRNFKIIEILVFDPSFSDKTKNFLEGLEVSSARIPESLFRAIRDQRFFSFISIEEKVFSPILIVRGLVRQINETESVSRSIKDVFVRLVKSYENDEKNLLKIFLSLLISLDVYAKSEKARENLIELLKEVFLSKEIKPSTKERLRNFFRELSVENSSLIKENLYQSLVFSEKTDSRSKKRNKIFF